MYNQNNSISNYINKMYYNNNTENNILKDNVYNFIILCSCVHIHSSKEKFV